MNQFINKLNLLLVEVYVNEITTLTHCIIQCYLLLLLFLPWLKSWIEVRDEKKIENSSGMHCFYIWNFLSAPMKTKTRKSCSRFEIKWQSTWFRHSFLNQLTWFSLERLHSFKKNNKLNKNEKKSKTGTESYSLVKPFCWWLVWVNFILSRINRNSS